MSGDPEIIAEDRHILVINKPSGLQVHPAKIAGGKRSTDKTLTDWLVEKYPEIRKIGDDPEFRPGIVHRLDKETSGVIIVPKDQPTFEYLKNLFKNHEIKKTYLAVVSGTPKDEKGTIDAPIGLKNGTMKRSTRSPRMAKEAVTDYKVIKKFDDGSSLLGINPKTGRTHQIRVHLASIGHPILGDTLYGAKKQPENIKRLMLHALSIEFTSSDGKRMKFEAEPPKEFDQKGNTI